jgi:hypothetical protein
MHTYKELVDTVNGRGVLNRHMSDEQRANLVIGILNETIHFKPSLKQLCEIFRVSPAKVRELKAMFEMPGNGNGKAQAATDDQVLRYVKDVGVGRAWRAIEQLID